MICDNVGVQNEVLALIENRSRLKKETKEEKQCQHCSSHITLAKKKIKRWGSAGAIEDENVNNQLYTPFVCLDAIVLTCMFERRLIAVVNTTTRHARSMGKFSSSPPSPSRIKY